MSYSLKTFEVMFTN